jgi:amino-acid N-acetyltransferase
VVADFVADTSRDFSLRPATAADAAAIKALIRSVRINPRELDWRRFVLAVEADGRLIGCGQVKPQREGIRELASIAVVREWRGRGAARAIIERLQETAGPPLYLTCTSQLVPLYQKFGFCEVVEGVPAHYRRLQRFARIILRFVRPGEYLAVMRWP